MRSFHPHRPWTKAHEKFAKAVGDLQATGQMRLPANWMFVRWGVRRVIELTPAQARAGCRQLNAWRGGVEGYVTEDDQVRRYPRQVRRNSRRSVLRRLPVDPLQCNFVAAEVEIRRTIAAAMAVPFTADRTAYARGPEFENLIRGTALADLGELMPTDSIRKIRGAP